MIREVVVRERRLVAWSAETGQPLLASCSCRIDVAGERCVCGVEFERPGAWMRAAHAAIGSGKAIPRAGKQKCRLCRHGDHDLSEILEIKVFGSDHEFLGISRVPAGSRLTKRQQAARAARAGGHPKGSAEALTREVIGTP